MSVLEDLREAQIPIYHVSNIDDGSTPACGLFEPGDTVVPIVEAHDPDGRHFNCPECMWVLTQGRRHVEPIEDWQGIEGWDPSGAE